MGTRERERDKQVRHELLCVLCVVCVCGGGGGGLLFCSARLDGRAPASLCLVSGVVSCWALREQGALRSTSRATVLWGNTPVLIHEFITPR